MIKCQLLPRKEGYSNLEVPLLLHNKTLAIVKYFDEILLLCDIISNDDVLIVKRKEVLLDMTDYINL